MESANLAAVIAALVALGTLWINRKFDALIRDLQTRLLECESRWAAQDAAVKAKGLLDVGSE